MLIQLYLQLLMLIKFQLLLLKLLMFHIQSSSCYKPRGSKEWIPCYPHDLKPIVSMNFDSIVDGIEFYKAYARFCKRLAIEKKRMIMFTWSTFINCNKQGFKEKMVRVKLQQALVLVEKVQINRGGCQTMIGLRKYSDRKSMVCLFHESHNSVFATRKSIHFCKNSRILTHKKFIFDNWRLNVTPNKFFRLIKKSIQYNGMEYGVKWTMSLNFHKRISRIDRSAKYACGCV